MYKKIIFWFFLAVIFTATMSSCAFDLEEIRDGKKVVTLVTNAATGVSPTMVSLGGVITYAGTPQYTERGVCYSATVNPTIANNKVIAEGMGAGEFSVMVSGLALNVTYYARAYAISALGTFYGEQVSFTTEQPMVFVQGGTFTMGSNNSLDRNASPPHQVTLSSYSIGRYQVTQWQWLDVMGSWPGSAPSSSYGAGDAYPAYYLSWHDIVGTSSSEAGYTVNGITYYQNGFCYKFSQLVGDGKQYRLPSEAEWEYAARGGNQSQGYIYSGSNNIGDVAWYYGNNSPSGTKPVGTKLPNELGIYDMSGNVYEWCGDWYSNYTSTAKTNPIGPTSGSYRVIRGGRWSYFAERCRVANRNDYYPGSRINYIGFRLACSSE